MKDAGDIAGWIMTGGGAVLIAVCLWLAVSGNHHDSVSNSASDHTDANSSFPTSTYSPANTSAPADMATPSGTPYPEASSEDIPGVQSSTPQDPFTVSQSASSTPAHRSSGSFTPQDAYEEGFEDGFEQGEYDRSRGLSFGADYDDSNDYSGHHEAMYCEGYEDGYHDGFASYTPSDYDDDPEDW